MFTPFSYVQQPPTSSYTPTVLIGGSFTTYNQPRYNGLIELNSSGDVVSGLNVGAGVAAAGQIIYTLFVQSDNKVVIGGNFTSYSGSSRNYLTRVNSDGTVDTTYNVGLGFSTDVNTIIGYPDNSTLVGGEFVTYSGSSAHQYLVRLNNSGSVTSSLFFDKGPFGFAGGGVKAMVTQSDGKIILGGNFTNYGYRVLKYFTALSSSGALIPTSSFSTGTGFTGDIYTIVSQSDGKIVVGGNFTSYAGTASAYITRLNSDGTRDSSFNVGTGFNSIVYKILMQSDNKILVTGIFTSYSGSTQNYITRLNSNGSRDTTFNIGTGFDGPVRDMGLQSDGKIYVGGFFTAYSGSTQNYITRLNVSGTRDTTFNSGTGFGSLVYGLAVQSDNKVIVSGQFTTYSGSTQNRITRINTDGTRDTTFNIGTGLNAISSLCAVDNIGKILVNGQFTQYSGSTNNSIVRINTDGTKDTTFNIGTGFDTLTTAPNLLKPVNDGVFVGSNFTTYSGSTVNNIVKIQPSGAIDTTFNILADANGAAGFNSTVFSGLPSGSVVFLGGGFTGYKPQNRIVRINSNGTIDDTFQLGTGFNNTVHDLAVQPDGKILAVGAFTQYSGSTNNYIVRLNTNGTKDTTFNMGTGPSGITYNVVSNPLDQSCYIVGNFTTYSGSAVARFARIQPSGGLYPGFLNFTGPNTVTSRRGLLAIDSSQNLLIGNSFSTYSGSVVNFLVKVQPSGAIDPTFSFFSSNFNGTSSGFDTNVPYASGYDTSNNLVLGGGFTAYKPVRTRSILSLTTSGAFDSNFNMGTGFNGSVYAMVTSSTGNIIVGGLSFNQYNNTANVANIITLNSNGTINNSINHGVGFNGPPYALVCTDNDQIVAAGTFTTYSGSSFNRVIRLNANGTRDTAFNVGTGFGSTVHDMVRQSDGKIIAVGAFTTYSGSTSNYIVRLNTDGTRDTTFNVGNGFSGTVYGVDIEPNGKIVCVGTFTTYSGSTQNRITRINTDGTRDTTFNIGTAFSTGDVYATKIQPDGKILALNSAAVYSGSSGIGVLVRINPSGTLDLDFKNGGGVNQTTPIMAHILAVDSTNSIYCGGFHTSYSGSTRNRIVKIQPSGAIDESFNAGSGLNHGFDQGSYVVLLR